MKKNFLLIVVCAFLFSCSSGKKPKVGEILEHDKDPCLFVPAESTVKKEYQEFQGESWPERNRVHAWETAISEALSNCRKGGFKVCKHDPSKDHKLETGKPGLGGKYFYRSVVLGEKVIETPRDKKKIKMEKCSALKQCLVLREKDGKEDAVKEVKAKLKSCSLK